MKHLLSILFLLGIAASTSAQLNSIDHWETVVFANDVWKYRIGTSEPDSNWRKQTFNDASWLSGMGGIGYGDGDDNTTISNTLSFVMRVNFNLIDTAKIAALVLHADYDDAFVAYINNQEIARTNIGTVGIPPTYNATANQHVEAQMFQGGKPTEFLIFKDLWKNYLQNGNNTLAIQVHNRNITSSDLSAIFFLSAAIKDTSRNYNPTPAWFFLPALSSNLPIININTNGQNILDDPRIVADMSIIDNGISRRNYFDDVPNDYNGKISIEIRGSSSQMFPKKGYGLETQDSLGNNNNVKLLGMPKENDWILHGPYSDKSLMRNFLIYEIGRKMGNYAPRMRFCEVYINNDYRGLYLLTEKIKRDDDRVDIEKLEPQHISGDELTGGYIVKVDKTTGSGGGGWTSPYWTVGINPRRPFIQFDDPQDDELVQIQKAYIQNYVTSFETACFGANFADPNLGYAKYIDVPSFIDFIIANEITKNVDGYRLSSFLYKDRDSKGGKLTAGPLWDFNLAFGNADYCEGGNTWGWAYDFNTVCGAEIPFWWKRFLQDTTFENRLKCRWTNMRQGLLNTNNLHQMIDSLVLYLHEAQERNFNRWQILGTHVWPNNYVGATYAEEITYLKNWISFRMNWIDSNLGGTCRPTTNVEKLVSEINFGFYPNPFHERIYFHFSNSKAKNIRLEIKNALGQNIETLTIPQQNSGKYFIEWNAPQNLSKGIYFYALWLDNNLVKSGKMLHTD